VINGIFHRLSTGCGVACLNGLSWQTVHKRHQLWSADGTWERLLRRVQAVADGEGGMDWDINVDSTSVPASTLLVRRRPGPAPLGASKGAEARSHGLGVPVLVPDLGELLEAG